LHPEIAEVHRGLGEVLALQGERQNAVEELQTAIRLNANDSEAHGDLGNVELQAGDATSAILEIESAIRLLPTEPKFHRELAAAYKAALRPADAEKEIRIYDTLVSSEALSAKGAGSHEAKAP
jgi:Flp pilus assembly protein TadD